MQKIIKLMFKLILPTYIFLGLSNRIELTKKVMTNNKTLNIFWKVVLFPINLIFSLIFALLKVIVIWILGAKYGAFHYVVQMLYNDLITTGENKKSKKVAFKRVLLFIELVVKGREKKIKYGKNNPDKTFYVIRPYYYPMINELVTNQSHLLFNYYRVLHYIAYAVNNGWIPVIDWSEKHSKYGRQIFMEDYPINGTDNGWEYFWLQPSNYILEEVYQSKNVILGYQNNIQTSFIPPIHYTAPYQITAQKCAKMCPRYDSLIKFNEPTKSYIDGKIESLFPKEKRVLGVSVRGGAYGAVEIAGHPVQPKTDALIRIIKQRMEEWKIEYVYFSCEAEEITDVIKSEFGRKAIVLERLRDNRKPEQMNSEDVSTFVLNPLYIKGQRYQTNLDYITEMALLAYCDCLLAGFSGGVRVAIIWNAGRYENLEIIDAGAHK